MKLALDICCGKGGATQAFRTDPDWHVLGIDNNPKMRQYWQEGNVEFIEFDVTVLDWEELKAILTRKGFEQVEFLWASPPCTQFSLANPKWPRVGIKKAMEIAGSCFEAVAILKPKQWLIENPRGRLRHLARKPKQTIFYSDYDDSIPVQKPTDLWGNVQLPMVPHVRRPSKPHGKNDRSCSWDYFRGGIEAAFVPLGVSQAVKTATEAQS